MTSPLYGLDRDADDRTLVISLPRPPVEVIGDRRTTRSAGSKRSEAQGDDVDFDLTVDLALN